jgi:hypothetical protein
MMACMKQFLETNYPLVDWTDLAPFVFEAVEMNGVTTITLITANWPSSTYPTQPTQTEITNWYNS